MLTTRYGRWDSSINKKRICVSEYACYSHSLKVILFNISNDFVHIANSAALTAVVSSWYSKEFWSFELVMPNLHHQLPEKKNDLKKKNLTIREFSCLAVVTMHVGRHSEVFSEQITWCVMCRARL